ncbi:hypothetical protein GGR32_001102, partial [Mesonia hippocampi]
MRNYYQTSLYVKSILSLLFALWVAYPSTAQAQAQTPTPSNGILYVNKNVTGGNGSGNSWANAIPELADALKWARTEHDANNSWLQNDSLQIYVAKGTYKPLYSANDGNYTNDANRDNAFVMVKNVQLYGGFDPTNGVTNLSHTRDFSETTGSILSGDVNDDDVITGSGATLSITNNTENAYHVVISAGNNGSSLIDGFSITGGNASNSNGTYVNLLYVGQRNGGGIYNVNSSTNLTSVSLTGNAANSGGGMYNYSSSPSLTNVSLTGNDANNGGGMYNSSSSSTPNLTNVTLTGNAADSGGGMYNDQFSKPSLTNVTITENSATDGGGMYNDRFSKPSLTNVTITENSATDGGGIYNYYSSPSLTNVTVAGNTATQSGDGMYNNSSSPAINNTIVWGGLYKGWNGNYTANHSLIEGDNNTNNGNIDATGLSETDIFTDPANGNYSLKYNSPAIDAGDNTAYTNAGGDLNNDTDLAGNTRLFGSFIDMGAYENQPVTINPSTNNILYVNKNVTGGTQAGDSWANATPELADALKWARIQQDADSSVFDSQPLQIYVAKGTYKPLYSAEDGNYTNDANRDNAFVLVTNVQLYGGFDPVNGITNLTHTRDFSEITGSILSGDFNDDDIITGSGATLSIANNTENAYHVVISAGNNGSSLIDGFSITGGNASSYNGTYVNLLYVGRGNGGGIYNVNSSPNLTNVSLTGNATNSGGGGMYNHSSSPSLTNVSLTGNAAHNGGGMCNYSSSPSLTNVSLTGNAAYAGGGMYNTSASPSLTNVSLTGNSATVGGGMYNISSSSPNLINLNIIKNKAYNGGGVYNYHSSPSLTNVSITENSATNNGGGMYNYNYSSPSLTNVTIVNNIATRSGGGMYNDYYSSSAINNTIVWGGIVNNNSNYTAIHSLIEGDSNTVNGNVDATGLSETDIFTDLYNGDYSLKDGSPAIDAGSNNLYTGDLNNDTDLAGNTRLFGSTIDIGAFEHHGIKTYWTGNINTDWHTAGNWTSGLPSTTSNAVIDQVTNQPLVAATNSAEAYSIVINPGASLSVLGDLSFQTSLTNHGDLLFLSNANATGQLTELPEGASITGNPAEVQRYIPSGTRAFR